VGSPAAVEALAQDVLVGLPGALRCELERKHATEVTVSASLTGFTTAGTAFHASAPSVAIKEHAAVRGDMEGGKSSDEGANVLTAAGAAAWDGRTAAALSSEHAVGANFIASFSVEFVDERGDTIRTSVHVTWDNRTRDVSKMYLDAAANVATSTSFFLRRLALLTYASTARSVIVAVVDAEEELRADVKHTCAVATAVRTLALRCDPTGAKLLAKTLENTALREDLAKATALLDTLSRKVLANAEAESRRVPSHARPTHSSAAAGGPAAGAAIVAVSGTSTGRGRVTVASTLTGKQRPRSATAPRGKSATGREPFTFGTPRFSRGSRVFSSEVPASATAGAGGPTATAAEPSSEATEA